MPTTGSKAKRQQNPRPVMLSKRANVFYLERPLTALTDKNRPISQLHGVEKLYSQRKDKYETWCDYRFYYDRFEEKQDFYDKAIADILGALK